MSDFSFQSKIQNLKSLYLTVAPAPSNFKLNPFFVRRRNTIKMTDLPERNHADEQFWYLRRPLQLLADVAVLCAAFFLAYLFRFDFEIDEYYLDNALKP